jgi:hypothetical protein
MTLLLDITNLTFPLLVVAGGAAVIARFRRSRGDERQQLKWFAYSVALMIVVFLVWFTLALVGLAFPSALMFTVPLIGLPIAVGIAVLRYRLYDIDVVINRTLVYGALTVALVLVYFGSVVVLQRTFVLLTGSGSQLTIVASTLAIAALFNPLRRRIQGFVDRRFYRDKYDATRTLDSFSARLRDETDLGNLAGDLLSVIRNTVHPEHASLWLRRDFEVGKGGKEGQAR